MLDLNVYVVVAAMVGFLVFLRLGVIWKVLAAFFVMTQCFDLLPQIVYGREVWDVGAVMLLIAAVQLMFARPKEPKVRAFGITLLWTFFIWLLFCLVYSLFVYGYPVLNTLKVSRQMIIGYLSIFVFLRLFRVDKNALQTFIKWLYVITYILLSVAIVQYVIGTPILGGLSVKYLGAVRYLPVFLPISLFYMWVILSKYFSDGIKFHEWVYGAMVFIVVATTYTRGIYIAVVVSFLAMLFLLLLHGRLKATSGIIFVFLMTAGLTILVSGGWMDRVIVRAGSGIDLVLDQKDGDAKENIDTFHGRLLLVEERIALVSEHNSIVGFGFLHENDVPNSMRSRFRYGSIVATPEMMERYAEGQPYVLALYSVDIGWANIVLNTGFVGSFLFISFVVAFLLSYKKMKNSNLLLSHYRIAFFVQTITLLILMFNGNPFTGNVQIAAFMIAGYWYCSAKLRLEVRRQPGPAKPNYQKANEDHVA